MRLAFCNLAQTMSVLPGVQQLDQIQDSYIFKKRSYKSGFRKWPGNPFGIVHGCLTCPLDAVCGLLSLILPILVNPPVQFLILVRSFKGVCLLSWSLPCIFSVTFCLNWNPCICCNVWKLGRNRLRKCPALISVPQKPLHVLVLWSVHVYQSHFLNICQKCFFKKKNQKVKCFHGAFPKPGNVCTMPTTCLSWTRYQYLFFCKCSATW